jgi:hypothetical protein
MSRSNNPAGISAFRQFHEVLEQLQAVHNSKFLEVKIAAADTVVFNNVGNDAARHIAGMPSKGDETVWPEWIRIVPVTAGGAEEFTTNRAQAAFKLAAIPRRIFTHRSGGENKFIAKGFGNGASGFKQRFEMRLGGLLKAEGGFAPVVAVRVAAGQQRRFGNPHAVFVLSELNFREWNNHNGSKIAYLAPDVKRALL